MELLKSLQSILPDQRIKSRLIDRISYASDAGFYRLVPLVVVFPATEAEVIAILNIAATLGVSLTFRAAGTSLSGQSISDGILVDVSGWKKISIEQEGATVRVQPGMTGGMVNAHLRRWKRKIGPDPASINSAMIGGIVSNNSSGMCCGVARNSYHTVRHIRFILPDGNMYSTEIPEDYARFQEQNRALAQQLQWIKESLDDNIECYRKIRHKYKTKNTVGYSLNAFLDYVEPLDIMAHLLIGAEGTLGFIAEVVMDTFPDLPHKATCLLCFHSIEHACAAVASLAVTGAEAIELMDRASLRAVEHLPGVPSYIAGLPEGAAALLVEYQAADVQALEHMLEEYTHIESSLFLIYPASFSRNAMEQALLWKVRKGLFPSVGAVRARGTTVILEDIAFPLERLASAITELQVLFLKHGYNHAIIFGHAKDGNIHFVITQDFNKDSELYRYECFIDDLVRLVVDKYQGALKAEHGTGRNMAPFVEAEWGAELYQIMASLKEVIDPLGFLNPGVIINSDAKAHLQHLKELTVVEPEVDKCMECGFCEHICPSRDITMTPRRRIVARRELQRFKLQKSHEDYNTLLKEYQYDGIDTCAVDGLCSMECPVEINTGDLVKRLRKEEHSVAANKVALFVASRFATVAGLLRGVLKAGNAFNKAFGRKTMPAITKTIRRVVPSFPLWTEQLAPASPVAQPSEISSPAAQIVYFPTCINRSMGNADPDTPPLTDVFLEVSAYAGIQIIIPPDLDAQCCGQLFSSKGYETAYRQKANSLVASLWEASRSGEFPVVVDLSSCTYTLLHSSAALSLENRGRLEQMTVLDTVDFVKDYVLSRVDLPQLPRKVALHPVCSLKKMGKETGLHAVAQRLASDVYIPENAGCCGMAGDRGFIFPELTQSATYRECRELQDAGCQHYYSTSKTCEMNLSENSGAPYKSIMYLVKDCIAAQAKPDGELKY